jgi:hypothetical protein
MTFATRSASTKSQARDAEKHALIGNAERGAQALQPARRGRGVGKRTAAGKNGITGHEPGDGRGRHDECQAEKATGSGAANPAAAMPRKRADRLHELHTGTMTEARGFMTARSP